MPLFYSKYSPVCPLRAHNSNDVNAVEDFLDLQEVYGTLKI